MEEMHIRQVVKNTVWDCQRSERLAWLPNHEGVTYRQARHEIAMILTVTTMRWRVYAKDSTIGEQNVEV
jgi:hypothetical protein